MTLEPVLLGLLAAYAPSGLALALALVVAFLARRPMQLCRHAVAARWALGVLLPLGALCLIWAIREGGLGMLAALAPAFLGTSIFLAYEASHRRLDAMAELVGASALACVPAAMLVGAGKPWPQAIALSGLMLGRALPAVLLVRAYLRRRKGRGSPRSGPLLASGAAVLLALSLAAWHWASWVGPAVLLMLFARAWWLLSAQAPSWPARRLGVFEVIVGGLAILAIGLGTRGFLQSSTPHATEAASSATARPGAHGDAFPGQLTNHAI